ncbi:MAG TPA: phosphoribosylformylglycinamidine synthase subunit PurL [Hypericibacter adhaerens]|uniref:Phosphoribosylformylglycinamidine synthase subunit PurL n=1 Tax=Hypericibacter adhaerens TaxID=2602016 RepID=A0A5J6N8N9_9PROT|nr:phosphoribosylformylglycinamidine synthase subunit PurL [Hypericibacter adhaerens]QEX23676.1 phosphoribosylformylglycinamidine synthase subunit PurL [Hypericibacter adhaerens]HWA45634.1 phosphoribosylformylglycinamidine synthase subunit PurL [Hypericibacter adhaerens]
MTPPAAAEPAITPNIVAEHGLTADEYQLILKIMGRAPNLTELGIFSVMWSEHCSYKSSRRWLKRLPTEGPVVIQGPGENAGVIDIGDGQAVVFKMESHNHPSFIEPYQGAATGVGGIMRDVFTMGARPIANLNALRFGSPDDPKTRHLIAGVVAGIGGYGNCMGVPTVGGEVNFHPSYNGNILVNAMTVGLAQADRIFYSKAAGIGNPVIYVGAKTGRDGIHGATMASAEFNEDSEEKRPTVQVGDPFTEKLLLEACLELMATDAIVSIQDMGAAGLTSSSVEMSSKGGLGIEFDLDKVPVRETGMTAYEIMLSESQERMLMVLKPEAMAKARAIFEKWELDFAEIGRLTDTGRLVLKKDGRIQADMPVEPLVSQAPVYDRPTAPTPAKAPVAASALPAIAPLDALRTLLACPDLASKRWIWEQYDHLVMGRTLQRPGGDAAVVRLPDSAKGLALSTDCTPRYCFADPKAGGAQAVAESWRNLTAVGATPLAITDNMNFGNPQRPEIMGQFAGCIEGMREACLALDYPVVSGNVSLYNETNGKGILPTPAIGGVGLLKDASRAVSLSFKQEGDAILLLGETQGHLGQSLALRELAGREDGPPPPVDLAAERRHGDLVRALIAEGKLTACHDLSDGGLLVALAEMAMAGRIGASLELPAAAKATPLAWLFGEDQGRYLVTCAAAEAEALLGRAQKAGVPALRLGQVEGLALTVAGHGSISVAELSRTNEGWLPGYMGAAE